MASWPIAVGRYTPVCRRVNSKIKMIKGMTYGFRDDGYLIVNIRDVFPEFPVEPKNELHPGEGSIPLLGQGQDNLSREDCPDKLLGCFSKKISLMSFFAGTLSWPMLVSLKPFL